MLLCFDGEQGKYFDPELLAILRNADTFEFAKIIYRYDQGHFSPRLHQLRDSTQATLLHYAAECGSSAAASDLIRSKCEVDAQDHLGKTPLMLAVAAGQADVFETLLRSRANIDIVDRNGKNAVQMLFELEIPPIKICSILFQLSTWQKITDCVSPDVVVEKLCCELKHVVSWGSVELFKLLFNRNGSELNVPDLDSGQTLLHTAVRFRRSEIAKLLIGFGADVDALDRKMCSPLYDLYGIHMDKQMLAKTLEVLKAIMSRTTLTITYSTDHGFMQIYRALTYGDSDAIKVILQYNIDLHATDKQGNTVLHYLASNCNIDLFELLAGRKFSVNTRNNKGETPLHKAAEKRRFKTIKFLLENGAHVNEANNSRRTALFIVFDGMFSEALKPCMEILLEFGADPQTCAPNYFDSRFSTIFKKLAGISYTLETNIKTSIRNCKVAEPAIARLAVIQGLGIEITEFTRTEIKHHYLWPEYFDMCERQVERMKKITIYGSVTLFRFLAESERKLTAYVRNEDFVLALEKIIENFEEKSPYLDLIQKRLAKAIETSALRENSVIAIQRLINLTNSASYVIADSVVEYFNHEDMNILMLI